jgi:hypothetical protein
MSVKNVQSADFDELLLEVKCGAGAEGIEVV